MHLESEQGFAFCLEAVQGAALCLEMVQEAEGRTVPGNGTRS
jgi:hypothetical protein